MVNLEKSVMQKILKDAIMEINGEHETMHVNEIAIAKTTTALRIHDEEYFVITLVRNRFGLQLVKIYVRSAQQSLVQLRHDQDQAFALPCNRCEDMMGIVRDRYAIETVRRLE
jgi:hypothetical protein